MNSQDFNWSLLVASLPTTSATARMRIWRSLKTLGCVALRDGAYLLPAKPECAAALNVLADEVEQEGGQAWLITVVSRSTEQESAFIALFNRNDDHAALFGELVAARAALATQMPVEINRTLRKFGREFAALMSIDFFPVESSVRTQAAWSDFQEAAGAQLSPGEPQSEDGRIERRALVDYQGRTWATRSKIWVDRVASAWLILRFIDPRAQFIWLAQPKDCPDTALGFDYDGATFTHVGEKVTFEVLMTSFDLDGDRGLQRLAALVHALDVGGPPPPEAIGFEAILKGASQRRPNDDALLQDFGIVLDSLYAHFKQEPAP